MAEAFTRRYTIFNLYIRGSNQSPQATHALNNLYKNRDKGLMSPEAVDLFNHWANNCEVEIMLQGGYHKDLEKMYEALSRITALPCAKFNESMEALNGACTVVTFVANDRIAAAGHYIRQNRIPPAKVNELLSVSMEDLGLEAGSNLTEDEVFVVSQVAFLPLAN